MRYVIYRVEIIGYRGSRRRFEPSARPAVVPPAEDARGAARGGHAARGAAGAAPGAEHRIYWLYIRYTMRI